MAVIKTTEGVEISVKDFAKGVINSKEYVERALAGFKATILWQDGWEQDDILKKCDIDEEDFEELKKIYESSKNESDYIELLERTRKAMYSNH